VTRRRRVVVYVTREHPVTGADELLVFDVLEGVDGELSVVVPGGGVEPGEQLEDTARREVLEETGLERIRVVREIGFAEQMGRFGPDFVHDTHFLQAVPEGPMPDEWDHDIPPGAGVEAGRRVRCRWVPIRPELEIAGNRGAYVHAIVRRRVVAYVTRERNGRTELLTIQHGDIPDLGTQVPAGRLDPGEDLEAGLVREVEEETGVTGLRIVRQLADGEEFERLYGPGAHKSYAFHAVADGGGPREWEHPVTGTGADAGFTYVCRWAPLTADLLLWGRRDPLLERVVRSIDDT
jgi:ADP-ribose pyrophosphatase YjhB (NUDIX family)